MGRVRPASSYRVRMTAESPGPDRCPACGAAVRPGDPWCTLCYADLRPPPSPAPDPVPVVAEPAPLQAYVPVTADPLTAPLEALSGPTWPCTTCGATNRLERDTCASCGAPFLSGLREQEGPLLELPVVGDLTRLGRGHRFALAGGVVLAFVLLTLAIGLLFG